MTPGVGRLGQILVLAALFAFALTSGSARAVSGAVAPNQTNMVDCNGWSPAYQSVKTTMRGLCTDFFISEGGSPIAGATTGTMSATTSRP